ncbi:MAG: hypothetical protein Q8R36_01130 [bacterium]|nr:hypothetical protein [bacterium]
MECEHCKGLGCTFCNNGEKSLSFEQIERVVQEAREARARVYSALHGLNSVLRKKRTRFVLIQGGKQ